MFGGNFITGYDMYQAASQQEQHTQFALPVPLRFANGIIHLAARNPAINAGDPAFIPAAGETDIDGGARMAVERGMNQLARRLGTAP